MDTVILYAHGCPRCKVLQMKLDKAGIQYKTVSDVEIMKAKGFMEAPKLEVNGRIMGFEEAVAWLRGKA